MTLQEKATTILNNTYKDVISNPASHCPEEKLIDYVIHNTHLTYKYVLFTAILSKAADSKINPLCLQKQSALPGAYDARTICHKVIVPFEMKTLNKALGGSNEPFLNKPARFPELTKTNAVRRGNDQSILNALCDALPQMDTSEKALADLRYLLTILISLGEEKKKQSQFTINDSNNLPSKLYLYINNALSHSFEGEVLTLMIAGLYHLKYLDNPRIRVEVHPVNQCGASGREVSDLDIYYDGNILSSNELKDKEYTEIDVRHAADKVLSAGGNRMLFIEGPHAKAATHFLSTIENEYLRRKFFLKIIPYSVFIATSIATLRSADCNEFMHYIIKIAQETKFKEEVISYLLDLAKTHFGFSK